MQSEQPSSHESTEGPPLPVDPFFGNRLSGLLDFALGTQLPVEDSRLWEPPDAEHIIRLFPQHEIEGLIGRGGMGAVYKGRRRRLNRIEAIKILPAELAQNKDFVVRFEREAQTLASLNHPGIVTIYDFGQTEDGHFYIVMEFVDGTDLHRIIQGPTLNVSEALRLTVQICEALQYAHDHDVIHRDIKPANVLVTLDGKAKLADFGLALKSVEAAQVEAALHESLDIAENPLDDLRGRLTKPGSALGTPDYAAPEMYNGESDRRSDIYALGIMLYEMLTGLPPKDHFELPSTKMDVDKRIDNVVVRALKQDPNARYQSATEMRLDVESVVVPSPVIPQRPDPIVPKESLPNKKHSELPPSKAKRSRRWLVTLGIVVGIFVIVGLGATYVMTQGWPSIAVPTRSVAVDVEQPQAESPAEPVAVVVPPSPPSQPVKEEGAKPTPIPPPQVQNPPAIAQGWTAAEQASFEKVLRSYVWFIPSRRWYVEFSGTHKAQVQEGSATRAWHWWIIGPRTLHVQFAAMGGKYDPSIGATYVFDEAMTKFDDGLRLAQGVRGKLREGKSAP